MDERHWQKKMWSEYQLDRARRNLSGYAVFGANPPLGVRTLSGDCGCNCGGSCGSTLRGLGAASTLSSTQAMAQAVAMYSGQNLNRNAFQNASWMSKAASEIAAGQFDMSVWASSCSGQPASNLNLFSTVSGLALGTSSAGIGIADATIQGFAAGTGAILGAATMGAGLIVSVIGMIFAHHAAAVKRDLAFSCSALPAVNNAFSLIAQAVQSGKTTAAEAAQAIPEIYSQYMAAGGAGGSASGPTGIPGGGTAINNHPYCNSNCEMSVILLGMVLYWQAQYAAQAASQAAAAPAPAPVQVAAPAPPAPVVNSGNAVSAPAAAPITASAPAQPGSGSAGTGPVLAHVVNSGSTLTLPAASSPTAATPLPSWVLWGAAAALGLAFMEAI